MKLIFDSNVISKAYHDIFLEGLRKVTNSENIDNNCFNSTDYIMKKYKLPARQSIILRQLPLLKIYFLKFIAGILCMDTFVNKEK